MRTVKVFNNAKAFEVAADKTRRRIIHLLRAKVLSVSQIADELEMTPQSICHHIRKMLELV
jgi:predicted transcriptional regulator